MANRGKTLDREVFTINDLKEKGCKKLPRSYRGTNSTDSNHHLFNSVQDNEAAYNRYKIRPRVLRDVSNIDTSTTILGTKVSWPFGFSPAASHKLAHPDGELATSRAAADAGICMALSAYATCSLEDVIAQGKGNPYFMQFSILKNRSITRQILQRAESKQSISTKFTPTLVIIFLSADAGYKAVMLTVDAPRLGRRLNEYRNSFGIPEGMGYPNILPGVDFSNLEDKGADLAYEDSLNWEQTVTWIRENTKLPIWFKGVYTADDISLAIQHGVDGVLISNHGGRQLDGVPATLDALRECAPVAKGKIKIAIDGGIRRGTDIFKALALGADYVFAGRVPIWGLAVGLAYQGNVKRNKGGRKRASYNGQQGVELAINLLYDEFVMAMALAGCKSIKDISKDHLSLLTEQGVLARL
ncbi:unnamed protein product [Clonostachys byssicola]|uniref:FMN hydroxy acid dehydrogenase domain-containing protein n=1 Tax=Clonostachys byssicola TaxID=160290 RepID=A0A9N9Y1Z4_9HYPO|nr:unnamed protein product [Clonostachys byssicola]